MNSVAMNILVRLFLIPLFFDKQISIFLLGIYLELQLLRHGIGLCLAILLNSLPKFSVVLHSLQHLAFSVFFILAIQVEVKYTAL